MYHNFIMDLTILLHKFKSIYCGYIWRGKTYVCFSQTIIPLHFQTTVARVTEPDIWMIFTFLLSYYMSHSLCGTFIVHTLSFSDRTGKFVYFTSLDLKQFFFYQTTDKPNFIKSFPFVIFLFHTVLVNLSFMQHIKVMTRYRLCSAAGSASTSWVRALSLQRAVRAEEPVQICCAICHFSSCR